MQLSKLKNRTRLILLIILINITKLYFKMSYSGPDSLPLKSESAQSPSNSGSVSVTEQLQSESAQSPSNSGSVSVTEQLQSESAQSPSNSGSVVAVVVVRGKHLPAIVASFIVIWIDFDDMIISDIYSCRIHACIYRQIVPFPIYSNCPVKKNILVISKNLFWRQLASLGNFLSHMLSQPERRFAQ